MSLAVTPYVDGNRLVAAGQQLSPLTRDERGNITFAEVSVLYEGEYDPTERFSVEYDGDGVARADARQKRW